MIGFEDLQVGSPLSYLAAFVLPALDAVVPVVPSETVVVALGVASVGSTDPRLGVLLGLAALGACLGDNLCYLIGRRLGPRVDKRFFASAKGRGRRQWAERTLERFGGRLIVACRFIPGGRTVVTFTCGLTRYRWRRFVVATVIAGTVWATYAFMLGRLGGAAFEDRPWAGFVLALGITLAVSGIVEVVRRGLAWRRRRLDEREP